MADPTRIEIDGFTYQLGRLAPRRASRLVTRLLRLVGPGLVPLVRDVPLSASGRPDVGGIDLQAVGSAVQGLLAQLTPEEFDAVMEELLSSVQVVGNDRIAAVMPIFDAHFDGRLGAVYKLMWASLQENFGSFFAPLIAAAGTLAKALDSRGSTTSAMSGSPGASS